MATDDNDPAFLQKFREARPGLLGQEPLKEGETAPATDKQTNLFEHGYADARQGKTIVSSRFRKRYRPLTPPEISLHDAIKEKASELEALFDQIQTGRYRSLAYTDLESSVQWAIKQLTA